MDYREKLTTSLASAREIATEAIRKAQWRYKKNYDRRTSATKYKAGEWILIRFPHEETGCLHKLSRSWHGPYHVLSTRGPDVTALKVYYLTMVKTSQQTLGGLDHPIVSEVALPYPTTTFDQVRSICL